MIDREAAKAAAEQILVQERQRLAELQNARAPRTPASLLVSGMSLLEPRHQAALVREATARAQRSWAFKATALAWVISIAITLTLLVLGRSVVELLVTLLPAFAVIGLRQFLVRRELVRLLSSPGAPEGTA